MIKFLITFFFLFFVFDVHAETCKEKLISILKDAKTKVNGVLAAGTPCHNAAMIGRQNGPPGCYPPDLTTLATALTPLHSAAKSACNGICNTEGKKTLCLDVTNKNNLKQKGINGVISWINASDDFASSQSAPAPKAEDTNVEI